MSDRERVALRIKQVSRWAGYASLLGVGVVVLLGVWMMTGNAERLDAAISREWLDGQPVPTALHPVLYLGIFISAPLNIFGLLMAYRLFAGYAAGAIFTQAAAQTLRRIGWSVALISPVANIGLAAAHAVLTWPNGGWSSLALLVDIGSGDVLALVFGPMLIVIGWVMGEAAEISDENKSFI